MNKLPRFHGLILFFLPGPPGLRYTLFFLWSQGYRVGLQQGESRIELLPRRITLISESALTLTRGDSTENYEEFRIYFEDSLYEFLGIVQSILVSEATFGDTEISYYMALYRNLKVEKLKQSEGTKVFILTDPHEDKFQFATRGIAWPGGYLNNEV